MIIDILEVENDKVKNEVFYNVVDIDNNTTIGILFTVEDHIVYEIKPEYRGNGAATNALKIITSKLKKPVLEIDVNNIASKRVALKAGYVLTKSDYKWEIYEYLDNNAMSR